MSESKSKELKRLNKNTVKALNVLVNFQGQFCKAYGAKNGGQAEANKLYTVLAKHEVAIRAKLLKNPTILKFGQFHITYTARLMAICELLKYSADKCAQLADEGIQTGDIKVFSDWLKGGADE